MSPTLLEGVVILIILVVAWQIGIRLAPTILGAWQRAIDQLDGRNPKQDVKPKLLTKEDLNDKP